MLKHIILYLCMFGIRHHDKKSETLYYSKANPKKLAYHTHMMKIYIGLAEILINVIEFDRKYNSKKSDAIYEFKKIERAQPSK